MTNKGIRNGAAMPMGPATQPDHWANPAKISQERDAWREIAIARGKLLTCYRTGTQRGSDSALKRIEKATKVLEAFGIGIDGELQ